MVGGRSTALLGVPSNDCSIDWENSIDADVAAPCVIASRSGDRGESPAESSVTRSGPELAATARGSPAT